MDFRKIFFKANLKKILANRTLRVQLFKIRIYTSNFTIKVSLLNVTTFHLCKNNPGHFSTQRHCHLVHLTIKEDGVKICTINLYYVCTTPVTGYWLDVAARTVGSRLAADESLARVHEKIIYFFIRPE